jgi:putative phage-type endonuclease
MPHITENSLNVDRRTYIGGTDVSAILGINQYVTPYEVWEYKVGISDPVEENDVMLFGRLFEPVILDVAEKRIGNKILNRNDFFQHDDYPFLGVHPDGITALNPKIPALKQYNCECKTVAAWAYNKWTEPVPFEYYCQIQHEMDIIRNSWLPDLEYSYFIVFVMDSRELHIDVVRYDEKFASKQRDFLIQFWNEMVVKNNPPDYQVSDFAKSNEILDSYVQVTEDAKDIIRNYNKMKSEIKQLEGSLKDIENAIKMKIGLNEGIANGIDVMATWKAQTRRDIDREKLAEKYPDVYSDCLNESSYRVLRVKK